MILSSFFISSLVRQPPPGRVMQVSSVCWVGVRIGLHSGRVKAEVQTDAPWCWGGPSARAVNDKLSGDLAVANHKIADDADGCIVGVCAF